MLDFEVIGFEYFCCGYVFYFFDVGFCGECFFGIGYDDCFDFVVFVEGDGCGGDFFCEVVV